MTFFFQTNAILHIKMFKNALALPSFKMAVNGCFCFDVHHKSAQKIP